MDSRLIALHHWAAQQLAVNEAKIAQNMSILAGDASFRRYYRVTINQKNYILMDAPPEVESSVLFVAIDQVLQDLGLCVPHIYASDLEQGFLLISDLGDDLYFRILNVNNADKLYQDALDALLVLQTCSGVKNHPLPSYDKAMYTLELQRFVFWFLEQYLALALTPAQLTMLQETFDLLIDSALSQPQVFTHRDYHSRNLLRVADDNVGILDFQDSVWGAITYDAVSLLRDCYIDWPISKVTAWALEFKHKAWQYHGYPSVSDKQFMRWFDLMGVQRHLKATYIFARKYCRDHQKNYLADLPRTLNYVIEVSQKYKELTPLRKFILDVVQPKMEQLL